MRGFTLIEFLITVAVMSVISLAVSALFTMTAQNQMSLMELSQLQMVRDSLVRNIYNETAWSNSVNASPSTGLANDSRLACIATGTPCTVDGSAGGAPIVDQPFAILDDQGKIVFDATNPSVGVDRKGNTCFTFSQTHGDPRCPFRYDLRWSAMCLPGNCVNPQVRVSGRFLYSPGTSTDGRQASLNTDRYSIPSLYLLPSLASAMTSPTCDDQVYQDSQRVSSGHQNGNVSLTVDFTPAVNAISPKCKYSGATILTGQFGAYAGPCFATATLDLPKGSGPIFFGFVGHKTSLVTASINGNLATVTDTVGGYGNCGGNQCAACLSDVKVTVHSKPK